MAGWQEVEVNILAGLAHRAAFPSLSSPSMGRRTTTSQMTHAQNGTILKSSRRRARSLLFRPVRCLSRPCCTQFNDRFYGDPQILAAMTPPHFQKKAPRRAPTNGSPGLSGTLSRGHSLPPVLSDYRPLNLFHQDRPSHYIRLCFHPILCLISSLEYAREWALQNIPIPDIHTPKTSSRATVRHDSTSRGTLSSKTYDVDVIEKLSPADPNVTLSRFWLQKKNSCDRYSNHPVSDDGTMQFSGSKLG